MTQEDKNLNNFGAFINQYDQGSLNTQVTEAMQEVLKELKDAVETRGGVHKGKVTLQFELNCRENHVIVTPKISTTLPKLPSSQKIFYMEDDGKLTRQDPRQYTMDELGNHRQQKHQ